jgi:hypothetical protein
MFLGKTIEQFPGTETFQEPKWLGIASASLCANDPGTSILHRAHEAQEYFTWHQVKSVANIAAIVSPAASLLEYED